MSFAQRFSDMRSKCLGEAGHARVDLRRLVYERAKELCQSDTPSPPSNELSDTLVSWIEKIALHSYKALDRDIEALRSDGFSEIEIFELTTAAAIGAAEFGLDCGLRSLQEPGQ